MKNKNSIKPRKNPKQTRSAEMNILILETATRILLEDGLLRLNTNYIAQKAGISVGSLYQYYPNKEAILAALIEKDTKEKIEIIETRFLQLITGSLDKINLERIIEELIYLGIEINTLNPELSILVDEQSAGLEKLPEMLDLETYLVDFLAAQAHLFKSHLKHKKLHLPFRIIFQSVKSMTLLMAKDRIVMQQKEEIAKELIILAKLYLLK